MNDLQVRFWAKVDRSGDCWVWTGARDPDGYGRIAVERKSRKATRVVWVLVHGPIPAGQNVLHRCDNPPCVRPSHLFLGTQAANGLDMAVKGRSPHSRLSAQQVMLIREAASRGRSHQSLADEYGVSRPAISLAVERRTWRHVA